MQKCVSCDAPATHTDPHHDGEVLHQRFWCEQHVPMSGHYEFCGKECQQLQASAQHPEPPKEKVAFEYRGLQCAIHGQSSHYRVRQKAKRHAGELSPPPKPWVCTFCHPVYPHL